MIKRLFKIGIVTGVVVTILAAVLATPVLAVDTQKYEEYAVDDDEAVELYGNTWGSQTFTTGTTAHSVTAIRLLLYREGSPGIVGVSIRKTTATDPSGGTLTLGTLDGDIFTDSTDGVWYEFDVTSYSLEASTMYAVIVRALAGDANNAVHWRSDGSAGAEANGQEETSVNGGATWTGDADDDFMFEIWGEPIFEVVGAQVFSGYREDGDWLIVLTYKNYYTPYYPNEDPGTYFYIQLLDDTTVKTQGNCPMWGYKPGSIYIAKSLADALEWGASDYKVRIYGDFGTNPYIDYNLADVDWGGLVDPFLDSWVITQAKAIGEDTEITLVISVADRGEVLNSYGHTMFSIGIPYLNEVRPDLFEMVSRKPGYTGEDYTHALQEETDWETRLGPQISEFLTDGGDLVGVSGDFFGGILVFLGFIGIAAGLGVGGHLVMGLSLGYPVLLAGAWVGVVGWVIIGVITFFMAVIFVYKVWLTR